MIFPLTPTFIMDFPWLLSMSTPHCPKSAAPGIRADVQWSGFCLGNKCLNIYDYNEIMIQDNSNNYGLWYL